MNGIEKTCAWCGNPFLANGKRKYCSDECAKESHRAQCRENFRRRYILKHEQELERNRLYYQEHPEQKKEYAKKWFAAHPGYIKDICRRYYAKNREQILARIKARKAAS